MTVRRHSLTGVLLATLALIVQLSFGLAWPDGRAVAAVTEAATICHSDGDASGPPPPVQQHSHACLICPLCAAVTAHFTLLPTDTVLPEPDQTRIAHSHTRPPTTAPPALPRLAARPRAPPILT